MKGWGAGQAVVQIVEETSSHVQYAIKFFLSMGALHSNPDAARSFVWLKLLLRALALATNLYLTPTGSIGVFRGVQAGEEPVHRPQPTLGALPAADAAHRRGRGQWLQGRSGCRHGAMHCDGEGRGPGRVD